MIEITSLKDECRSIEISLNYACFYVRMSIAETETGRIFYSPPRPDQKKLLTAPTRPELNLSFAPRPASPRSEFHLCSPAPPRPDLSFTFAPRPAPPRLQKIHLFCEYIIYLIIQYKGSVNKIGTHAEKYVQ